MMIPISFFMFFLAPFLWNGNVIQHFVIIVKVALFYRQAFLCSSIHSRMIAFIFSGKRS